MVIVLVIGVILFLFIDGIEFLVNTYIKKENETLSKRNQCISHFFKILMFITKY